MAIATIKWDKGAIKIIDQTLLPSRFVYLKFKDLKGFWHAIKKLQVRGAPALGVAAAYGAYLGIQNSRAKNYNGFMRDLDKVIKFLENNKRHSYPDYLGKKNFPSVTERDFLLEVMGGAKGCKEYIDNWIMYKNKI